MQKKLDFIILFEKNYLKINFEYFLTFQYMIVECNDENIHIDINISSLIVKKNFINIIGIDSNIGKNYISY